MIIILFLIIISSFIKTEHQFNDDDINITESKNMAFKFNVCAIKTEK